MKKNNKIIKLKKEKQPPLYARILIKTGLAILALSLAFGIMFLISLLNQQTTGADSAEQAAIEILKAIDNDDETAINNILYFNQNNYADTAKNLKNHAKLYKDRMSFDIEKSKFEEQEWKINSARKETKVDNAEKAICIKAKVAVSKTSDTNTYNSTGAYDIKTFCINNRWYVYSVMESYEMIDNAISQKEPGDIIGNDKLGYLSAMSGWKLKSETNDRISVESESGILTISAVDSKKNINNILKDLAKDKTYSEITECDISGMQGQRLFIYEPDSKTQTYLWVFKQPLRDEYLHYIELITTDAYKDYVIINNYSF